MTIPTRHAALLVLGLVAATGTAAAAGFSQDHAIAADALTVLDLVGEIRVEPATGDRFEIHVAVQGEDASPELIQIELKEGREAVLEVRFPIDEHRSYVYPPLGSGSETTIWQPDQESDGGWWSKVWRDLGGEKVTIRGSGRGLEVWADVTVRVPAGREASVYLGAGEIGAHGVDAALRLDTHSGPVTVVGHRGDLVCDTGSGSVEVSDTDGPLLVDTGSGAVTVANQRGGPLKVDTGSGHVDIEGADTADLRVDTGSGGVTARRIKTDQARLDTGSGAVELQLDRMGVGSFVIDTGSGGVELLLPGAASATITVATGSGRIRADVADAEVLHKDEGELKLRVGAGAAPVVVDTGSGGVTIANR